MTHPQSALRARPHPGIIATALTVLAYSDPPTAVDEPKAIDDGVAKPPRDLTDTHAVVITDGKYLLGKKDLIDDGAVVLADKKVYADGTSTTDISGKVTDLDMAGTHYTEGGNILGGALVVGNKAGKGFGKTHGGLQREAHHGVQVGITDVPVRTEGRDRAMHWVN